MDRNHNLVINKTFIQELFEVNVNDEDLDLFIEKMEKVRRDLRERAIKLCEWRFVKNKRYLSLRCNFVHLDVWINRHIKSQ
jgi:hypothetical protein